MIKEEPLLVEKRWTQLCSVPFDIKDAQHILTWVRASVAFTVFTWVSLGPFSNFYTEQSDLLFAPSGLAALIPSITPFSFQLLKATTLAGCLGMLFPRLARFSTVITTTAFGLLNGYVSGFSELWNYNTHLNLFLLCLAFDPSSADGNSPSKRAKQRTSAILYFMRFEVAILYLQAGLSKLIHGGPFWYAKTPYVHLVLQDRFGKTLFGEVPNVVALLGALVLVVELLLPFLLLNCKTRTFGVFLAILLHVSFYFTLGISFWHLWVLFPALFLVGLSQDDLVLQNWKRLQNFWIRRKIIASAQN